MFQADFFRYSRTFYPLWRVLGEEVEKESTTHAEMSRKLTELGSQVTAYCQVQEKKFSTVSSTRAGLVLIHSSDVSETLLHESSNKLEKFISILIRLQIELNVLTRAYICSDPTEGRNYILKWFFFSNNFGRSIYSS